MLKSKRIFHSHFLVVRDPQTILIHNSIKSKISSGRKGFVNVMKCVRWKLLAFLRTFEMTNGIH